MDLTSLPVGEELSKFIQGSLGKLDPNIFKTLGKLTTALDALSTLQQSLSGATQSHPYLRLKEEYLGKDYQPKTLEDIEAPEEFSLQESLEDLQSIQEKIHQTNTLRLSAIKNYQTNNLKFENIENYFATLSGDQFVLQKDKTARFLEFVETIKTMNKSITKDNPVQLAQKIVSHYIKTVGPVL